MNNYIFLIMRNNKKKVYCRGTDTGCGVIEALESYGGINSLELDGTDMTKIYFISPMNDEIHSIEETKEKFFENETMFRILYETGLYTEIKPDESYYTIVIYYGSAIVKKYNMKNSYYVNVNTQMNPGNRYATAEEAQAVADKINKLFGMNLLNKPEDEESEDIN